MLLATLCAVAAAVLWVVATPGDVGVAAVAVALAVATVVPAEMALEAAPPHAVSREPASALPALTSNTCTTWRRRSTARPISVFLLDMTKHSFPVASTLASSPIRETGR